MSKHNKGGQGSGRNRKQEENGFHNESEDVQVAELEQGEGHEEGAEDEPIESEKGIGGFDVKAIAEKVREYIQENFQNVDKASLGKYIPLALLVLFGMRKSGIMGNLVMLAVVGFLTTYLEDLTKESGKEKAAAE